MKTFSIGGALLLSGFLLVDMTAQQHQAPRMDEWKALEISLRGVKSIHPGNGFVPDESTAVKVGEAVTTA